MISCFNDFVFGYSLGGAERVLFEEQQKVWDNLL